MQLKLISIYVSVAMCYPSSNAQTDPPCTGRDCFITLTSTRSSSTTPRTTATTRTSFGTNSTSTTTQSTIVPTSSAANLTLPANIAAVLAGFPQLSSSFVQNVVASAINNATRLFGPFAALAFDTLPPLKSAGSLNKVFGTARPENLQKATKAFALEQISAAIVKQISAIRGLELTRELPIAVIDALADIDLRAGCEEPIEPEIPVIVPCASNRYRTHSGYCNNPLFPNRGRESTIFQRMLPAAYDDGISSPRRLSVNCIAELPSPRLVSTTAIGTDLNLSPRYTHLLMQFGQFLDHDLTSTPQTQLSGYQTGPRAIQCCGISFPHDQCSPISIPSTDEVFSPFGTTCMEFVRSLMGIRPGCSLGAREQVNQLSAFIDGGQIYGTTPENVNQLRSFTGGQLLLRTDPNSPANSIYTTLPGETTQSEACRDGTPTAPCFVAGDARVNEQIGLQVIHTTFARYHNVIARKLAAINPNWNDERLYQESRNIVIAQLQHITYKEWLPMMLGQQVMIDNEITLRTTGYFNNYNNLQHPQILSEFSTAAFRVGHVLVTGFMNRFDAAGSFKGLHQIEDTFFRSNALYSRNRADEIMKGLCKDAGKLAENQFSTALRDNLFKTQIGQPGLDLAALNIQRGRDHGLSGFLKYREICGLPTATDFAGLASLDIFWNTDAVGQMQQVYSHVDDIDLFVGGIAEKPVDGGVVGPTFACIIAEQFRRLRTGDRFWYENNLPAPLSHTRFTLTQLAEIRKTSMARILCDTNLVMPQVQPRVFEIVSPTNSLTLCANIPTVSFIPWTA